MSGALHPVKLLRVANLADRWSVSKQSIHNLIRSGRLPSIQIGSAKRIHPDAVTAYERENLTWHAPEAQTHPTASQNGTGVSMSSGGTERQRDVFHSARQIARKQNAN
ncbi:hypothetical protein AD936_22160 [Gluconobacter japonicus]|nr:hypothetical protein AD936_22160 [Gluconobacter japonicus]